MIRKNTCSSNSKRCMFIPALLIFCFMISMLAPVTADAATTAQLRKLTKGKSYTCYDVTGDGKHDTFSYKQGETGYTNFYLNGKYVSRTWSARGSIVYWARITNGKVFLIVNYSLYGGYGNTILQYKGGKFKPVSGEALDKYNMRYVEPSRVAGYSIFFTGGPKFLPEEFAETDNRPTGTSQFRLTDGSFKLVTRYLTVGGSTTYRTKTSFRCSTSNKQKNTDGMYVPAGANVNIVQIFMPTDGGGIWYKISYQNRTGWLHSRNV